MRKLSRDEIMGKVQGFPDAYKHMCGEDLDISKVIDLLSEEETRIKERKIKEAFSDLDVSTIRSLIAEFKKVLPKKRKVIADKIKSEQDN